MVCRPHSSGVLCPRRARCLVRAEQEGPAGLGVPLGPACVWSQGGAAAPARALPPGAPRSATDGLPCVSVTRVNALSPTASPGAFVSCVSWTPSHAAARVKRPCPRFGWEPRLSGSSRRSGEKVSSETGVSPALGARALWGAPGRSHGGQQPESPFCTVGLWSEECAPLKVLEAHALRPGDWPCCAPCGGRRGPRPRPSFPGLALGTGLGRGGAGGVKFWGEPRGDGLNKDVYSFPGGSQSLCLLSQVVSFIPPPPPPGH